MAQREKGQNGSNGHDSNGQDSKGHESNGESSSRTQAKENGYTSHYEPPPRRSKGEREDAFDLLAWLVEGAAGIANEVQHNDLGLSEEFWTHFYAMRREGLLTTQALIECLLEQTERQSAAEEQRQQRHERRGSVSIDF